MRNSVTPVSVLMSAIILCCLSIFLVVSVALNRPWIGMQLAPDDSGTSVVIRSVDPDGPSAALAAGTPLRSFGGIALEPFDVVEESDVAATFAIVDAFFARQDQLATALTQPAVSLATGGNAPRTVDITPAPTRPIGSLPVVFWVQILSGAVSAIVGIWVMSLRRGSSAARLLALAGVGVLVSAYPAAIYSSREIALPGDLFHVLSAINHLGTFMFGAGMVPLMLSYPACLVRPRRMWWLPAVLLAFYTAETFRLLPLGSAELHHLPVVLMMLAIAVAAVLQYIKSKHDPVARAAVRWFGLSVALGAGTFVLTVLVPPIFAAEPIVSQGYAFALFAALFLGVAAAVARYRLFDLDRLTLRILFYFGAVALLLLIDAALIYVVSLGRPEAFALSLLAVALVYLPLRDLLTERLTPPPASAPKPSFAR